MHLISKFRTGLPVDWPTSAKKDLSTTAGVPQFPNTCFNRNNAIVLNSFSDDISVDYAELWTNRADNNSDFRCGCTTATLCNGKQMAYWQNATGDFNARGRRVLRVGKTKSVGSCSHGRFVTNMWNGHGWRSVENVFDTIATDRNASPTSSGWYVPIDVPTDFCEIFWYLFKQNKFTF